MASDSERRTLVTTFLSQGYRAPPEWAPGAFRLFNVNLSPKFRYCLETETYPVPTERLRTLSLSLSERAFANSDLTQLECDGDYLGDSATTVLESHGQRLRQTDPDVLVPWRAWEPESFKTAWTLHDGDRGGFTFEPEMGMHENVVEIDFASLYPSIMCAHNLSPETIRCDCHDRADVPHLGYSICDESGFVPSVLRPIIDDRAEIKRQLSETDDPNEQARLASRSDALRWILVTCFGYQGFSNSKFGRIEVHQSINASARAIIPDARQTLEDGGWRVVHGIVDSLWVTPDRTNHEPLSDLTDAITREQKIALEHEDDFEWVCFVPTADGKNGALTKYFGKVTGRVQIPGHRVPPAVDPTLVAEVQRALIEVLDEHWEPTPVADRLARHLNSVRGGSVDPSDLVIRSRVSKPLEAYQQRTRTVAALERYEDHGMERSSGQDVRYVVVDDEKRTRARVRLPFEADGL